MSILSVQEMRDSPQMGYGLDGDRTYTRTFIVISDDKNDGPVTVVSNPDIPRHYDTYAFGNERDRGSVVVDIDPQREPQNPLKWVVTVSYDSKDKKATKQRNQDKKPRDTDDDQVPDNMEIRYSVEAREKALEKDAADGKAVKNAAGDKFNPPPVAPDPVLIIDITRDEDEGAFEVSRVEQFVKTTNKRPFFGFPTGACLFDDFNAQRQFENNEFFWRVNYRIAVRDDDDQWQAVLLEYGPNVLRGTTRVRHKDTEGSYTMARLSTAGTTIPNTGANSSDRFAKFTIYGETDFNRLHFDDANAGL